MVVICEVPATKWNYEMVTETLAVPGPSTHTITTAMMEELEFLAVGATEVRATEDWPYHTMAIWAKVVGEDLAVRVIEEDGSNSSWPVYGVFLRDHHTITVWWKPYPKEPSDRTLYTNGAPDFFAGTISRGGHMTLWGTFGGTEHHPQSLVPSIHDLSETDYDKLLHLPGVKRKVERSLARLPPSPVGFVWEHLKPSLATIIKPKMFVQWGEKGGYFQIEKLEIMPDEQVRVTWKWPMSW